MASAILMLAFALLAPAEAPLATAPPASAEDLSNLIQTAGDQRSNGGADAVVVLDRTAVRVEETGLAHYRRRRVIKALSEKGATKLSTLRFDYDPTSNVVEIPHPRVHPRPLHGQAHPPIELTAEHIRDLPQPQHWIYWGPRMKVLSLPRLAVGDAIEVESYTKGFIIAYLDGGASGPTAASAEGDEKFIPPMRGHFYDVVLFGDADSPTRERRYEVTLPRDKPLQFEVYNGKVYSAVTFSNETTSYAFWSTDLPAHLPEKRAADPGDYLPKVVMATAPNWQAKSRWFHDTNKNQFAADKAIKAKVAQITRAAANDDEKISAILHWTAQEIRYSGISMGKGEGYTLHSGQMTFHDRAGVCKDIAGMSITFLRAAGFESYPAMTMAGGRVEKIPADQFNHCVVAVKRPEGFRMLDPTWAPFSAELWSSAEREQHYVIGTPDGETLMKTPYLPPEHNRINIDAKSEIAANGDLSSEIRVTAHGYPEDRLRRFIAYHRADELRPAFTKMLGRVSATATLDDIRFSDHRDLSNPLTVTLKYRAPGFALMGKEAGCTQIPVSAHPLGDPYFADWLEAAETSERTSSIWLRSPQLVTLTEIVKIPPGFKLLGPPVDEEFTTSIGSIRAALNPFEDGLRWEETIRIAQRNIATTEYADFKKVVDVAATLAKRRFYLRATGDTK